MLWQLVFLKQVLRLTPLLLLIRGGVLLCAPGVRCRTTLPHECGVLSFWLYLAALCYLTVNIVRVLHGNFEMGQNYNLTPFAEIRSIAASGDTAYALLNILGNVLLFLPLGFLLPLLWRRWRVARIFFTSLILSSAIETLQLFTGRGTDIDDVILNTVGGVCGYLGFLFARSVFPGLAARFHLMEKSASRGTASRPAGEPNTPPGRPRGRPGRVYRRRALAVTALALCVLVSGAVLLSGFMPAVALAGGSPSRRPQRQEPELLVQVPTLNSEHALLICGSLLLYEQGADQRIYPASMTKIMTAVLALEDLEDLEQPVYLREEIFSGIGDANLATAGFLPGEEARALDLLYGLMLPSGAECAVGLAERIAGSQEAFALLMNAKALELNMKDTHFVNATGMHDQNHYTTAADLALLMRYALENPVFRAIVTSQRHSTAATSLRPEGITFSSTLLGNIGDGALPEGVLLGGKTGYTDQAGQCLASFAVIGGQEYILITAGARPEDFRGEQLHIDDAVTVYSALS